MPRDRQSDARATALAPSLVQRVAAGVALAVRGTLPDWFGPGVPVAQVAPAGTPPRQHDYDTGYNLSVTPRRHEPVTFAQLRALADAHDLTRLAIERRKNQMESQEWTIARVDGQDGDPPPALVQFWRRPDRDHTWRAWLRMVVEEVLVTDATSLYLRPSALGSLYAVEQLDGATINRLLDARGRTPAPPAAAYQQIIKGVPAVPFTREELLYLPRNPRAHRVYGYSPVEQIIVTVNLALRRQAHQLSAYTEGTIPDMLIATPEAWQPDQIRQFQRFWDELFVADPAAARRKARFVPGGMKPERLHTAPLFDEGDEWLARVVCWAFDLPPNALVKQVNRAQAEQQAETAEDEGLRPLMLWVQELVNLVIQEPYGLGMPGWEFRWKAEREVRPEVQAAIDTQYIAAGVRTAEQVALERFGVYEAPAAPEPAEDDDDTLAPRGAAAKAAGRSLRRRHY